ncbi:Cupredoxin, partial [Violaceomyces palustris]
RTYHWVVERKLLRPDGVERDMIVVNGQFPGPTIEANVGDRLRIRVENRLPYHDSHNLTRYETDARARFSTQVGKVLPVGSDSMISIHWHGLSMRGSPDQDGAPGFASDSFGPGQEYTYDFTLGEEDSGTHWWHSHSGMSRSDGLWGALIVRSRRERELVLPLAWDEESLVTVGDHYHKPSVEQLSWFLSRHSLGFEPTPESSLINGVGRFDCHRAVVPDTKCDPSAGRYAEITFLPSRAHRVRFINVGAVAHQTVSIDEHMLTVIESDGQLVEPFSVERLSIAPGQRYSVVVLAKEGRKQAGSFWLRSEMDQECFNVPNPALNHTSLAIVRYRVKQVELRARALGGSFQQNRGGLLPTSSAWKPSHDEKPCHDVSYGFLKPLSKASLPAPGLDLSQGDRRVIVSVTMPKLEKHQLVPMSYMNRTTWRSGQVPLIKSFADDPSILPKEDADDQLVVVSHTARTIEVVVNNLDEAPHPFHLHGHKFWVMETSESKFGWGKWEGEIPDGGYDLDKAPFRDTVSVPRRGYAVLRWRTDNPGVWAFHCHVLVHMASGMAMAFVDQP